MSEKETLSELPPSPQTISFSLNSPSFKNEGMIPSKHTCDGENISPELNWTNVPKGAKSFVLIVDDPDAVLVAGHVWDHWILYNIPGETRSISENNSIGTEGMTSFGKPGYGGPCPPNGEHSYLFKLYALDSILGLPAGSDKKTIEETMEEHILEEVTLRGRYSRA